MGSRSFGHAGRHRHRNIVAAALADPIRPSSSASMRAWEPSRRWSARINHSSMLYQLDYCRPVFGQLTPLVLAKLCNSIHNQNGPTPPGATAPPGKGETTPGSSSISGGTILPCMFIFCIIFRIYAVYCITCCGKSQAFGPLRCDCPCIGVALQEYAFFLHTLRHPTTGRLSCHSAWIMF